MQAPQMENGLRVETVHEKMGEGTLVRHRIYLNGTLANEVFTLRSLAHVLGLSDTTVNGRYARSGLKKWAQPVHNGFGRPERGFNIALLDQVRTILSTPGVILESHAGVAPAKRRYENKLKAELVPTYYNGEQYYTMGALAASFGLSISTMRTRIETCGLMRFFVDLAPSEWGGRPRKGISEKYLGDVQLAVVARQRYMSGAQRSAIHDDLVQAKLEMMEAVAVHTPPTSPLQAWDDSTLAPVKPAKPAQQVNAVKPKIHMSDTDVDDLVAQLEELAAGATISPPVATVRPAYSEIYEPDAAERKANHMAHRAHQLELLGKDKEPPTPQELEDTTHMLDMSREEADAFIAEVYEVRKENGV